VRAHHRRCAPSQPPPLRAAAGRVRPSTLLPPVQVPYVSQAYASGNHCNLDPDEDGGQRSILRRSELRLMCR
jgi:hypothetical protein